MRHKQLEVVECLKKSLDDERAIGSILTLEDIMFGKYPNNDVRYRVLDSNNNPIKTVPDLIKIIDLEECEFRRVLVTENRFLNGSNGARVILKNTKIQLFKDFPGDNHLRREGGWHEAYHLGFTMADCLDNDKDHKVKLIYTSLEPILLEESE